MDEQIQRLVAGGRLRRPTLVAAALAGAVLAGCSGSPSHSASSTTTAPPPPSTSTTSTTAAPAAPPTTASVIGLVVSGQGSTLVPPTAPTVKPYNPNCQSLVDTGFAARCEILTSPAGSVAALVEVPKANSGNEGVVGERDLVYHRTPAGWTLALRRVRTGSDGSSSETVLWQSDVNRDGDPKAVFVIPAQNEQYGQELDVVETTGQVIMYRQLKGGFASVAPSGGLLTFVPDASGGYDQATIKYSAGEWRITSATKLSQTQAQADGTEPFNDPRGQQAEYAGNA